MFWEHNEFVLMQKLACIFQTTLIELMVREILSYDACEQETCTELCFGVKQIQFALEFHHIL